MRKDMVGMAIVVIALFLIGMVLIGINALDGIQNSSQRFAGAMETLANGSGIAAVVEGKGIKVDELANGSVARVNLDERDCVDHGVLHWEEDIKNWDCKAFTTTNTALPTGGVRSKFLVGGASAAWRPAGNPPTDGQYPKWDASTLPGNWAWDHPVPIDGLSHQFLAGDTGGDPAWRPAGTPPTDGQYPRWNGDAASGSWGWSTPFSLPTGGRENQVLVDGTTPAWGPSDVPTAGQRLAWSGTAFEWQDKSFTLPTGGRNNQLLAGNGTGGVEFKPQAAPTNTLQVLAWDNDIPDFKWVDQPSLPPDELPALDDSGYTLAHNAVASTVTVHPTAPTASTIFALTYGDFFHDPPRRENIFVSIRLPYADKGRLSEYRLVVGESDAARIFRTYASNVWTHVVDAPSNQPLYAYYHVLITDKPASDDVYVQRTTPTINHQFLTGGRTSPPAWSPSEPPDAGDVIVWEDDGFEFQAPARDRLNVVSRTLTKTDFQNLKTKRILLLDAPPLGQYILLDKIIVQMSGGSTALNNRSATMAIALAPSTGGLISSESSDATLRTIAWDNLRLADTRPPLTWEAGWLRDANYVETWDLTVTGGEGPTSGSIGDRDVETINGIYTNSPLTIVGWTDEGPSPSTVPADTRDAQWTSQTALLASGMSFKVHIYYEIWDPSNP